MSRARGRLARVRALPILLATLVAIAMLAAAAVALIGARPSARPPLPRASAATRCSAHASSLAAAARAVAQAPSGGVVCLASGRYAGTLSLVARHSAYVTLRAAPGAHVRTGAVRIAGSHIALRDIWVHGEIALEAGSSFIVIDRDDVTGGGEGIVFDTSDCTVPNAPIWAGCEPQAPITDITISHNHIHDIGETGGEDAIHLDNWRRVTITGNEFDHIIENGEHTDCMQSVYGGDQLKFDHNYEHDNDCQGFFIKDGDATNVAFTDNLFLRDQIGSYANFSQFWNIQGLTIQHNTIWDGKGLALVTEDASFTPTATIDHNVIETFTVERPVGNPYTITERENLFGERPWSFRANASDRGASRPRFVDPAHDDYRLVRNRRAIGVDWSPAGQHYGPAS
jgi:hypothetical protein